MKTALKTGIRALRNAILVIAVALPAISRADDLDSLLTQPPSASISREDAAHRIEMLRALVADHPDREAEIEAYLIPFVRATQPPPAAPTPTPAPRAAKPKPLLLIKSPDGQATTMRAASYQRQGAVLLVTGANGSHAVLQALTLVGEVPWYAEEDLASGAVDLKSLAERYSTFARAFPAMRSALQREADRLNAMQRARDDAATEKRNTAQARLAEVTSAHYDPAAGYTPAAIAALLLEAEKARNEMPGAAAKIDEWAALFREHFAKLLAGQSYVNGAWISNEELARQAREKRQAAFLGGLDYQIGTEAFPEAAGRGMVTRPLVETALALVAGVVLLILGRSRRYLRIAGAVVLVFAPLTLAAAFFLATRNPALLPRSIAMADEQSVVDALSQAAGLEDGTDAQKISGDALNAFFARHVRLVPSAGSGDQAPTRESVVVRLLPDRVLVFEMIRSMGLNWVVRIDVSYRQADGKPAFTLIGAKIGALDCPATLAAELWKNLEPQLAAILKTSRLAGHFSIQIPAPDLVELKPLASSADGSSTRP